MKLIRPDKISIDNVTAWQVLDNLGMTVEKLMEQVSFSLNMKMIILINSRLWHDNLDNIKIFRS